MTFRRTDLLAAVALLCAGAFGSVYLVALHTAWGLAHDRLLFAHVSGTASPQVHAAGAVAIRTIDVGSVVAAAIAVTFFGVMRGRLARALAALGVIVCSVATAELLKHGLRHVGGTIPPGREPTFPSGHTSIAVGVGLALVLAAPPVLRLIAALIGAAYGAGIGLSVIVLGWHYPSDVVGSFFICGFWACVFGRLLDRSAVLHRPPARAISAALAAMGVALLLAAVVAERHQAAIESLRTGRALVGMAVLLAVLSLAVFFAVTPLVEEPGTPP